MKKWCLFLLIALTGLAGRAQHREPEGSNTLLWQISGNGMQQPSYLFGTIHMLCKEDAVLSDSLLAIIGRCRSVYLEVDMDNLFEMVGMMSHLRMRGDTTLGDLLSPSDYQKVKEYFANKGGMIPFSMLETFKPMLAMSTLEESDVPCENPVAMEQLIMEQARQHSKPIQGLETMAYQASLFDSIPYRLQAEQLVSYVDSLAAGDQGPAREFARLADAYRRQDLRQLEDLLNRDDETLARYADLLLYNRNRNWVNKLGGLLGERTLLIAVGAGHLPGAKGLINLLRKAGYRVTPVRNEVHRGGTPDAT